MRTKKAKDKGIRHLTTPHLIEAPGSDGSSNVAAGLMGARCASSSARDQTLTIRHRRHSSATDRQKSLMLLSVLGRKISTATGRLGSSARVNTREVACATAPMNFIEWRTKNDAHLKGSTNTRESKGNISQARRKCAR